VAFGDADADAGGGAEAPGAAAALGASDDTTRRTASLQRQADDAAARAQLCSRQLRTIAPAHNNPTRLACIGQGTRVHSTQLSCRFAAHL
jgi:hypothetical protein